MPKNLGKIIDEFMTGVTDESKLKCTINNHNNELEVSSIVLNGNYEYIKKEYLKILLTQDISNELEQQSMIKCLQQITEEVKNLIIKDDEKIKELTNRLNHLDYISRKAEKAIEKYRKIQNKTDNLFDKLKFHPTVEIWNIICDAQDIRKGKGTHFAKHTEEDVLLAEKMAFVTIRQQIKVFRAVKKVEKEVIQNKMKDPKTYSYGGFVWLKNKYKQIDSEMYHKLGHRLYNISEWYPHHTFRRNRGTHEWGESWLKDDGTYEYMMMLPTKTERDIERQKQK